MAINVDVVVIGAGPGGYVAAIRAAQLGQKVVIVERENMGGICLNWGCIPTKALLRSVEVFGLMRRANEFGIDLVGEPQFNLDAIVARSRKISSQLSDGINYLMKKNKIEIISGTGKLIESDLVEVETKDGRIGLRTPAVILATGARARELPGLEADGERVWSYRHALQPDRVPARLLVIGSGAIGVEFASFYCALGSNVTLVEARERILPNEDAAISVYAKKQFQRRGMHVLEGACVAALERRPSADVDAHLKIDGNIVRQQFDTVISAIGITGNVENLGLERLGVKVASGHVITDEYCRTSVPGIYAIGDVAAAPWLAHKASHEGTLVAEFIAGLSPRPLELDNIPGCTYCEPQIASVGLTEEQALERGRVLRVGIFPFSGNGKAIAGGHPEGFVKTVFDRHTGELLGAHMIGAEVTELIHGFVVAKTLGTTEEALMETVYAHPTMSEGMHESVLAAWERALHI